MTKRDKDILNHLVNIYKEFYCAGDIFKKGYFKYTIDEVEEVINKFTNRTSEDTPINKAIIRDEIKLIENEDMVKQFYLEHLKYNKDEVGAKEKCLKSISLEELKLIYSKIYSSEARNRATKDELLSLIEKYFNGIERALSMKP